MPIDLKQTQAVTHMANLLYDFLPGSPNPFANQRLSFPGCASKAGVGSLWIGGSKKPAIAQLLSATLEKARDRFCPLLVEIIHAGIIYRSNKANPVTREEVVALNGFIKDVGFKIPELWAADFLHGLPSVKPTTNPSSAENVNLTSYLDEFVQLSKLDPHPRGFAFQEFLNKIFYVQGLAPKGAFRLQGEEIDGSFELNSATYLLEAKWQTNRVAQKDLAAFGIKVGGKSTWSRGLIISYSGFTPEGLHAWAHGKQTNIIGMDSLDLVFILQGKMDLKKAIELKARHAAETNKMFISVYDLANR